MFTARILMATIFLIPLPATLCATQVQLKSCIKALSTQTMVTYGLNYLKKAATFSPKQPVLIEQALKDMISC